MSIQPAPDSSPESQADPVATRLWDDLIVARERVNPALLHEELAASLPPEQFAGLSTGAGIVRVHVRATLAAADRQRAEQIVAQHDPDRLTAAQASAQAQRALSDSLAGRSWDAWDAAARDDLLRLLAWQLGLLGE